MKKKVFSAFFGLALLAAFGDVSPSVAPSLTAEQNGSQKKRYVVTVEGTNCWAREARTGAAPYRCEAVPVVPPTGARFTAAAIDRSGDFSVPGAASSPRAASTQTVSATVSEPPLLA